MADLYEVLEEPREGGDEDSEGPVERNSVHGKNAKRRRSRKRRNSGGQEGPAQNPTPSQDPEERGKENGSGGEEGKQQMDGRKPSTQEDHRARFFEHYRKEAEEYDREFMKKYDEDLNTTLIFAGLFSAVTSAFIIYVQPQLQPDSSDETAALLRVLIYKFDNTTFGNDAPTIPQWTGPPHAIVQIQATLYASLAATLLSAFLAMLGKQWLNRYASTDMRGTAVERSQNRQNKLDGIVAWYFDTVMESLPLMLQIALLLLGCALSLFLWEINITVASVVVGVTSFGTALYLFIVVAGLVFESCPYQTPGANFLRHVLLPALRSAPSAISNSELTMVFTQFFERLFEVIGDLMQAFRSSFKKPWYSPRNILLVSCALIMLPIAAVVMSVYGLGFYGAVALPSLVLTLGWLICRQYIRYLDRQAITLDLRCISWVLETSLDKVVHLSALKHLEPLISTPTHSNPALAVYCLNAFIGCIDVSNHEVMVMQGLEQLATVSALCFFHTISYLSVMDPTSNVLNDVTRRYTKVFPANIDFRDHQFSHIMNAIRAIFIRGEPSRFKWSNYKPPSDEHTIVAHTFLKLTQLTYQRMRRGDISGMILRQPLNLFIRSFRLSQVPHWILNFTLHSLSTYPLPPNPVVADCLSIVAVDLDCDVPNTGATISDESVRVEQVSSLITQKLETMAEDHHSLRSKREAITALLLYAVWQEKSGKPEMLDALLHAVRASRRWFAWWPPIDQLVSTQLSEASPRALTLVSPYVDWYPWMDSEDFVQWWVAGVSAVPYTEEVAQGVVDMLLRIAPDDKLVSHIPVDLWLWLTRQPPLPPVCKGRRYGTHGSAVEVVRGVKNIEVLKSYFLLVWSEWDALQSSGFDNICASIREDFGGVGMRHHREDLTKRLDHVLGQLDYGLDHFKQRDPEFWIGALRKRRRQYRELKEVLLEVERLCSAFPIQTPSQTEPPV